MQNKLSMQMIENDTLPKRKKLRLENYDYSTAANYFVTIVVQNRSCLFGEVSVGQMFLNDAGKGVNEAILHLPDNQASVISPYHVVMPNHIHVIFTLNGGVFLAEIIRRFKSYTTNLYTKGVQIHGWQPFDKRLWQHNYYEHIIRNQRAYDFIANYIFTNPQRWMKDAINPQHEAECEEIMKQVLMYG